MVYGGDVIMNWTMYRYGGHLGLIMVVIMIV